MFLLVNKSGRYWHFRFWLGVNDRGKPKERVMALGVYPDVSLSKAQIGTRRGLCWRRGSTR